MQLRHYLWWTLFALIIGLPLQSFAQLQTNNVEILRAITYATIDRHPLLLDIYRPANQRGTMPVVLAVHGGAWTQGSGDRTQLAPLGELLASRGYAVVAMDYRLLPSYHFPAQIDDIRAAARWAQACAGQYRFNTKRNFSFGVSAGGQLAALLALQPVSGVPRIIGVIDFFGPMDFTVAPPNLQAEMLVRLYLNANRQQNPQAYLSASPITYITPASPPFLIVHGTADTVVPYAQSERMANALLQANVPVTLFPLPEMGHEVPGLQTDLGKRLVNTVLVFLNQPGN